MRNLLIMIGLFTWCSSLLAQETVTIKGSVNYYGQYGDNTLVLENFEGGEQNLYTIQNAPAQEELRKTGIEPHKVKDWEVIVKKTGMGFEYVNFTPAFRDRLKGIKEKNTKSKANSAKDKKKAVSAYLKKYKSVGPSEAFLKSEIETQDSNYKPFKFAVVELHNFYASIGGNPKWKKLKDNKWELNVDVKGEKMTWIFEKNDKAIVPSSLNYNSRTADHGTIHRFLEQVANAIPELRKKS